MRNSTPVKYELYGFTRDKDEGITEDEATGEFIRQGHVFGYLKTNKGWVKIDSNEVERTSQVPLTDAIAQTFLFCRKIRTDMIYPRYKFE